LKIIEIRYLEWDVLEWTISVKKSGELFIFNSAVIIYITLADGV